jgi:hypothetical protein
VLGEPALPRLDPRSEERPSRKSLTDGSYVDPDMNGTFQINRGLKIARRLLLELTELGIPAAGEFLGESNRIRSGWVGLFPPSGGLHSSTIQCGT